MPAAAIAGASIADSAANMAAQEAIAAQQRENMLRTTAIQAKNAETAALCNMILDCIKALNELRKKGGAMMGSAIGQ
ncbi:hypothetical protein [Undibacterium sp. TS12]|uniref:hypothetical protein n=1 Tax=Undibacterium sp. TS12 TaxID=2908202 RepID=UPI001F4CB889|nr:hypothetical protein [Undibacterium sp. TS12]MCH8621940.1 hypothetical protein [Undibacterium sp. TS12]